MTNPPPPVRRPGITETTLVAARVYYSDYPEPSYAITYWLSDGTATTWYRYRILYPGPDGAKYWQEPNSGVHVYFPPDFYRHGANGQFGIPPDGVVLAESEFKALSDVVLRF
jgi:hypothetical protein